MACVQIHCGSFCWSYVFFPFSEPVVIITASAYSLQMHYLALQKGMLSTDHSTLLACVDQPCSDLQSIRKHKEGLLDFPPKTQVRRQKKFLHMRRQDFCPIDLGILVVFLLSLPELISGPFQLQHF